MDDEFTPAYSRVLARSHAIHALGDRTAVDALEAGVEPRRVWRALCDDMDVPEDRRLGRDLPIREHRDGA